MSDENRIVKEKSVNIKNGLKMDVEKFMEKFDEVEMIK
jgi:hypothetical protein